MVFISKISKSSAIDFAAEELKKYIRMMDPGLDVIITDEPLGFKLGLMSDFGLDTSDCQDSELDDVVYIDTADEGGIIAGSNPRSVLLAVYELLRQNGCRWLFPGVDGEYIPAGRLAPTKLRKKPDMRFRGPCLEGSVMQEALIDMIDFLPKVGMNMFETQFFLPIFFFRRHYCHWSSEVRANEHINERTVRKFMAMAECEMKKRGLQYHAVGHGWTATPFDIDASSAWTPIDGSKVPSESVKYLAEVKGARGLFRDVPTNTQFCMSNPEARKIVADYVVDYAVSHSYVDFIHFYLADAKNNHCECNECVKKTPSDWMVILLNEIDAELTERGLKTIVVFPAYTDTTWAPKEESINNPGRFVMMLAPITRSYTRTLGDPPKKCEYMRNEVTLPEDLASYLEYYKDWRGSFTGSAVCFEYYFWLHQYFDVSTVALAKRIFEDIECYAEHGFDGLIACGTQRPLFPNGFAYYLFAMKQYDMSLTYEEIKSDYFIHAYGELADEVYEYFEEISDIFGQGFMEGEETLDRSVSEYYNPKRAKKLQCVTSVTDKARAIAEKAGERVERERTEVISFNLLKYHALVMDALAYPIKLKAEGKNEKAVGAFEKMRKELSQSEIYVERQFDFGYFIEAVRRIIKGKQRDEAFAG